MMLSAISYGLLFGTVPRPPTPAEEREKNATSAAASRASVRSTTITSTVRAAVLRLGRANADLLVRETGLNREQIHTACGVLVRRGEFVVRRRRVRNVMIPTWRPAE